MIVQRPTHREWLQATPPLHPSEAGKRALGNTGQHKSQPRATDAEDRPQRPPLVELLKCSMTEVYAPTIPTP